MTHAYSGHHQGAKQQPKAPPDTHPTSESIKAPVMRWRTNPTRHHQLKPEGSDHPLLFYLGYWMPAAIPLVRDGRESASTKMPYFSLITKRGEVTERLHIINSTSAGLDLDSNSFISRFYSSGGFDLSSEQTRQSDCVSVSLETTLEVWLENDAPQK